MRRLKDRRIALGLSQLDLEERSGVSQNSISRYESGGSEPTAEGLRRLARALEVSIDWLLGLTDDPTPRYVVPADLSREEMELIGALRRGDAPGVLRVVAEELDKVKASP